MKEPERQRNLNTIIFVGEGTDALIFQTGRERALTASFRLSQEQRQPLPESTHLRSGTACLVLHSAPHLHPGGRDRHLLLSALG